MAAGFPAAFCIEELADDGALVETEEAVVRLAVGVEGPESAVVGEGEL